MEEDNKKLDENIADKTKYVNLSANIGIDSILDMLLHSAGTTTMSATTGINGDVSLE